MVMRNEWYSLRFLRAQPHTLFVVTAFSPSLNFLFNFYIRGIKDPDYSSNKIRL